MKLAACSDRCSGCRACLLTCALTNFGLNNPRYGALSIVPHFPSPGTYEVKVCIRCGACKDACPVRAISELPGGSYRVDQEACTGCGACVDACPENVVRFVAEKNVAFVCTSCGECVKYCPREAIVDEDGEVKRA
jgi:ferredoxin